MISLTRSPCLFNLLLWGWEQEDWRRLRQHSHLESHYQLPFFNLGTGCSINKIWESVTFPLLPVHICLVASEKRSQEWKEKAFSPLVDWTPAELWVLEMKRAPTLWLMLLFPFPESGVVVIRVAREPPQTWGEGPLVSHPCPPPHSCWDGQSGMYGAMASLLVG